MYIDHASQASICGVRIVQSTLLTSPTELQHNHTHIRAIVFVYLVDSEH